MYIIISETRIILLVFFTKYVMHSGIKNNN